MAIRLCDHKEDAMKADSPLGLPDITVDPPAEGNRDFNGIHPDIAKEHSDGYGSRLARSGNRSG